MNALEAARRPDGAVKLSVRARQRRWENVEARWTAPEFDANPLSAIRRAARNRQLQHAGALIVRGEAAPPFLSH